GRNSTDAELRGLLRVVVDVDLRDGKSLAVVAGEFFQDRCDGATRAAPGRPEVDQHEVVSMDKRVELIIVYVHRFLGNNRGHLTTSVNSACFRLGGLSRPNGLLAIARKIMEYDAPPSLSPDANFRYDRIGRSHGTPPQLSPRHCGRCSLRQLSA